MGVPGAVRQLMHWDLSDHLSADALPPAPQQPFSSAVGQAAGSGLPANPEPDREPGAWTWAQVGGVVAPNRSSGDFSPGEITAAADSGGDGIGRASLLHGIGARRLGLVRSPPPPFLPHAGAGTAPTKAAWHAVRRRRGARRPCPACSRACPGVHAG